MFCSVGLFVCFYISTTSPWLSYNRCWNRKTSTFLLQEFCCLLFEYFCDFHHILFCFYKDCHDSFDNELIGCLTFCVVIKDSFMILHVSFVISMIFTEETLSCGKEDTFPSFSIWRPLISFSHLIALRVSVLCWSIVQSVHPWGKAFILSPLLCSFHNGICYVDVGIIYCL